MCVTASLARADTARTTAADRLPAVRPTREEPSAPMTDDRFAIDSLRNCPLFTTLRCLRPGGGGEPAAGPSLPANEVIFHQGDAGDSLHIITTGSVKIVLPIGGGRRGDHRHPRATRLLRRAARCSMGSPARRRRPRSIRSRRWRSRDRRSSSCSTPTPSCATRCWRRWWRELRRLTGHVEELHFLDLGGSPGATARASSPARPRRRHRARIRPRLAVHPIGPGGHDRRHPPEREQAPRRAHRGRPGAHRARAPGR